MVKMAIKASLLELNKVDNHFAAFVFMEMFDEMEWWHYGDYGTYKDKHTSLIKWLHTIVPREKLILIIYKH